MNLFEMKLFEDEWGVDKSPVDKAEITYTQIYFEKKELQEFKSLCKKAMKEEFPETFKEEGNISDLLLIMLRKNYGNK